MARSPDARRRAAPDALPGDAPAAAPDPREPGLPFDAPPGAAPGDLRADLRADAPAPAPRGFGPDLAGDPSAGGAAPAPQDPPEPPQPRKAVAASPARGGGRGKGGGGGRGRGGRGRGRAGGDKVDPGLWTRRAFAMLLLVFLAREALNLIPLIPVHFDEAQYWVYGRHFDFGYFSKPPLAAWMIRAGVEVFGDDLFGLRVFAPLCHLVIGAFIFLIGRRLFEARIGFWAAALYTAAPGVSISSMLMTTDPPMMIGWAIALYAYIRATEPVKKGRAKPKPAPHRPLWWLLVGLGIGTGMMAKYTAIAAAVGVAGHLRFSADPRPEGLRRGLVIAAVAAVLALSPNLIWNAMNGFATVLHLGDNASFGDRGPMLRPGKFLEFLGAQFGVIGPSIAGACLGGLAMLAWRRELRAEPQIRLLAWFTAPLLGIIALQALREGANANWAAPAFIAGSVLAAHLIDRWGLAWARWVQVGVGAGGLAIVILLGAIYLAAGDGLPRLYDPFKKMRLGGPFCEIALGAMENEGADALLTNDRRRLSECMFLGDLRLSDVAFVDEDGRIDNHFDMAAPLREGDDRLFLLATIDPNAAERIAARFETAEFLGEGAFDTHSDRATPWALWIVEGVKPR